MFKELKAMSLRELLGYAIYSEEEAAKFYRHLVKDFDEKSLVAHKFESIAKDEDMHKWVLQDLYRELFGTDDYKAPPNLPPFESMVDINSVYNLVDALETAMANEYKHSEITEKVLKGAYRVYNELGHGFSEEVYENALAIELRESGLSCQQQHPVKVFYRGQLVNYLKATELTVGLLINFGRKIEIRRRIFDQ